MFPFAIHHVPSILAKSITCPNLSFSSIEYVLFAPVHQFHIQLRICTLISAHSICFQFMSVNCIRYHVRWWFLFASKHMLTCISSISLLQTNKPIAAPIHTAHPQESSETLVAYGDQYCLSVSLLSC